MLGSRKENVNIEKKYSSDQHCKSLSSTLNTLRQHNQLCDVKLIVEGKEFPAHRAVLAGASLYFQNLFMIDMKEKREGMVEIEELKCTVMEDLLEFIYTGDVVLTSSRNAVELLKAASYTSVCHLEKLCEKFLKETLSVENCLAIYRLAAKHDCVELKKGTCDFIKVNFSKVLNRPEFLELTEYELEFFLSSDDIEVKEEEEVYEGLIKWIKHDPEVRRNHFAELFFHIRLGSLSKQVLFSVVAEEEMVCSDPSCMKLALKASSGASSLQKTRKCLEKTTDVIVVCAGRGSDLSSTKSNICYVPSTNKWFELADSYNKMFDHTTVELDGFLYVIGGCKQSSTGLYTTNVSRYDSRNNTWSSVASVPQAISYSTAVALKGYVYVIGGREKFTLQTVYKYCPVTNCWELSKPLTVSRVDACSVSDDKNIYTLGGETSVRGSFGEYEILESCEKYESVNDSWSMISPMRIKRSGAAASLLKQQIFVTGGYKEKNEATQLCDMYDIPHDTWYEIAPLQVPRCLGGAAVVDDKIYLLSGGGEDRFAPVKIVECYFKEKNEWQVISQMPKGRVRASVCALKLAKVFIKGCTTL